MRRLELSSLIHTFDPMSIDVGEEDLGSPLNYIDELVDAPPAALALPVRLVQEQRLEEPLPQSPVLQHQHGRLWESGESGRTRVIKLESRFQAHVSEAGRLSAGSRNSLIDSKWAKWRFYNS